MGAIIDILIAVIICVTLFLAVKRGFVKTALGTLGFFIAAAVAVAFCGVLGNVFAESALGAKVETVVSSVVDGVVSDESYDDVFENEDGEENKSALSVVFSAFGAEETYDTVKAGYASQKEKGLEAARSYIKDCISEKAVPFCCDILAFLLLYFGTRLVLKIAESVIGKLTELPVLKQADKLLGVVAGLLLAALRVWLFCVVLRFAIPVGSAFGISWIAQIDLNDSVLYSLFDGGNILFALI